MRRLQISITSCFFHHFSFLIGGILLTAFTPSYRKTAVASPISCGLSTRNGLVARSNLLHRVDDPDTSWLAASSNIYDLNQNDEVVAEHQDLPSDTDDPNASDEPAPEPYPNPQPGPPPPFEAEPRPLPKPQPIQIASPQPEPGTDLPVPGDLPPLPPVPLPVPGALPLPIPDEPIPEHQPRPSDPAKKYPNARPVPQPVGGVRGGKYGGGQPNPKKNPPEPAPSESVYPDDDEIRKQFLGVGLDQGVMYTETGSLQYPRAFAESFTPNKLIYLDCWPYGWLDLRMSSQQPIEQFREFNERNSKIFSDACSGTVWLISKFPDGPEYSCSLWSKVEWPALIANPKVVKIILVNYLDFSQQREIWPNPEGDPWPKPKGEADQKKSKRQTVDCHNADLLQYNDYSGVASGLNVDLTPIMGNAAGWASVDVIQYHKNDPDQNPTDNFKLDITVLNAHGEDIGHQMSVIAPAGQKIQVTSKLPYAVGVTTQTDSMDLLFDYAQTSWDSNDKSPYHECFFDEWKGASREGKCKFDY